MGSVFIQLLLEFYRIHFIKNLKPNNFEQTNKIVLLFLKKLKKHYVLQDKCGLILTFKNRYKVLFCTS